jgi:hypothetical protein
MGRDIRVAHEPQVLRLRCASLRMTIFIEGFNPQGRGVA